MAEWDDDEFIAGRGGLSQSWKLSFVESGKRPIIFKGEDGDETVILSFDVHEARRVRDAFDEAIGMTLPKGEEARPQETLVVVAEMLRTVEGSLDFIKEYATKFLEERDSLRPGITAEESMRIFRDSVKESLSTVRRLSKVARTGKVP